MSGMERKDISPLKLKCFATWICTHLVLFGGIPVGVGLFYFCKCYNWFHATGFLSLAHGYRLIVWEPVGLIHQVLYKELSSPASIRGSTWPGTELETWGSRDDRCHYFLPDVHSNPIRASCKDEGSMCVLQKKSERLPAGCWINGPNRLLGAAWSGLVWAFRVSLNQAMPMRRGPTATLLF